MEYSRETANRSLFTGMPGACREALLSAGTIRHFHKGQSIFGEVDSMTDICILTEGYVCLYRSSYRGEYRVIFVCGAGEILNELVLENQKTSVAAKTLSDASVLYIPRESLSRLMEAHPVLMQAVFHSLALKTRRLYHKVGNDNGTYTLKTRLMAAIRKLARDYGVQTGEGMQIRFDVTVNFLSAMLGAKRETISRALSELKREGIIRHENGGLTVPDLKKLFEERLEKDV